MSDLTVLIEENPVTLAFDDQSFNVLIEETNTIVSVPQEITQVTLSNQDVVILTVAEQGPPGASGGGSGGLVSASQVSTDPNVIGQTNVQDALEQDYTFITEIASQVNDIVDVQLQNKIDVRFGSYILEPGVTISTSSAPANEFELVNKEYVDTVAFPIAFGTSPPSSPSIGTLWLDTN